MATAPECAHDGELIAEFEGDANPDAPLSIMITCKACGGQTLVTGDDMALTVWETG